MATQTTRTVAVTIDAPIEQVARDLADPATHPEWGTEFFAGPALPGADGEVHVNVPLMGGPARLRVESDVERGIVDLYLAPGDAPYGPALPIRLVRNGDGVDVLFTLTRFPGQGDGAWEAGVASMKRELDGLRRRHEAS